MSIIIAFFCGICFTTLADSVADYISACASRIEAQAEAIKLENKAKALKLDIKLDTKTETADEKEPQE
mgnify:CR=1 FL=1